MKPTVAVLYGDATSAGVVHALKAWRQRHAPGEAYEGMIGNVVESVEVTTRLLPGGRATVVINVNARRHGQSDQYYYELTLVAGEIKLASIEGDHHI